MPSVNLNYLCCISSLQNGQTDAVNHVCFYGFSGHGIWNSEIIVCCCYVYLGQTLYIMEFLVGHTPEQ